MKSLFISLFAVMICGSVSAQIYAVKKVPRESVQVDGTGSSPIWRKAVVLTDFVYPWDSIAAPATSFAALWDGDWLYCLYRVKDDTVITPVVKHNKIDVGYSDRVEIFLKKNDSMTPYYCLELDASGRILDYNATYYRAMNFPWEWPQGQLVVKASRTKDGYIVEFAIGIQSLNDLGLLQNHRLQAGLFRAERKGILDGMDDLHWISWIKPRAAEPDFHIPSAFGELILK